MESNQKENSIIIIGTPDGEKHPLNVRSASFYHTYEGVRRFPILCFTYLKLENDFIKDGDTYTLKDEIVDSLLEQFPERDAILFKLPDFFSQFDKGLRENGYEYKRDLITYYNEKKQTHPLEYEKYEGNPFLGLFYKRGFFKLQKEYRIALADFSDEDVIINIGNIRGCTEVWSIETIRGLRVQMIEIEEG